MKTIDKNESYKKIAQVSVNKMICQIHQNVIIVKINYRIFQFLLVKVKD